MGKEIAENPQLSVYYNDGEHVTIHSTILLTSTQYYLQKLHTNYMRFEQVRGSNLLHKSACLYCPIQVSN